jgi:branched-chain amino acid transport system permease protein
MIYGQVLVDGIMVGLMFALVAMGLSLIYGVMNIVNFAHGEFMMLAMYFCFFMWSLFGLDPLVSTPLAAVVMFFVGVAVYRVLIRHVLNSSMVAQIFATFGLLIFIQAAMTFLFRTDVRSIPTSWVSANFELGGVFFNGPELVAAAGALLTSGALYWFINRTETGLALQAVAEDAQAARLMGIDSDRMYGIAWGVACGAVAIGGGLLSTYYPISPLSGARWVLPAFVAVAIGGFGSISGAFLGGLIIGVVQTLGGFLTSPNYKSLFVFGLYLVVVFWRPYGLLGRR